MNSSNRVLILCDFDGTVSTKDTVNRLIRDHIISTEWRYHVKRYLIGEIGSKAVYEAVAPLMRMSPESVARFVENHAALDPAFPAFLQWAQANRIDVKIVSDGFDLTIDKLFANHGISGLEVFVNRLVLRESGRVEIHSPYADPECGTCGTCKLGVLRRFRSQYDKIILIGDGESDRHAAREADLVLGLKDLFVYCAREGIPCLRVEGFSEVPWLLTRKVEAVTFDLDGTLLDSVECIADAFNHMFRTLGYPLMTKEQVARKTNYALIPFLNAHLKPGEGPQGVKIFRDYYDTVFLKKSAMMPGAIETLAALNGTVRAAIVTNKRGFYARKLAEHLGFDRMVEMIIGAEDGFKPKPAADMFEEFIRSVGAAKSNTIYVGDTPLDIEAARNAGIDAFAVTGPVFSAEELAMHRPRRVLRNIAELPDALEPVI